MARNFHKNGQMKVLKKSENHIETAEKKAEKHELDGKRLKICALILMGPVYAELSS